MADEQGAPGSESGGEFRQKFEATQAENAGLRAVVAEQFGVPVEELKGVAPDQIVSKAQEVQAAAKAAEEQVLRKALGLPEDADLEAALAKVRGEGETNTQPQQDPKPASAPFTSTGSLGGSPPSGKPNTEGLFGVDRIAAALEGSK